MPDLPNLLVIGAMKCGTSSLHTYLGLHPEISMSEAKELNYFLPRDAADAGSLLGERSSRDRGREWYRRQFGEGAVRGESSVAYSFPWFEGVAAAAAAELGPAAQLIYVVRDPVERMLSHRDQFASRDNRPLAEALLDPHGPYLRASSYATALAPFLESFGRERILILDQARLRDERDAVLAETFGFLGVEPGFRSPETSQEANVSAGKGAAFRVAERVRSSGPGAAIADRLPRGLRAKVGRTLQTDGGGRGESLDPADRARLLELLVPEIAGIETLTGWDLSRWRAY